MTKKYSTSYSNSKAETVINGSDIDDVFESVYITIISNIQRSLGKSSGWINDSVTDHTINISKYKPLTGSSYIKLPRELDHPGKDLINIKNIGDNECFKLCLVRYLHPADHNLRKIRKFGDEFNFLRHNISSHN